MPYLPHIYPIGAKFYITFRLDDSLPQSILNSLKDKYHTEVNNVQVLNLPSQQEHNEIQKLRKQLFGKYDHQLDVLPYGACYMMDEKVTQIIYDKIMQYNDIHYKVIAFCVMPNHVHMLLDTSNYGR